MKRRLGLYTNRHNVLNWQDNPRTDACAASSADNGNDPVPDNPRHEHASSRPVRSVAAGGMDISFALFVAALCLAAMAYGFAAATYKLFPYQLYANARDAYHALREIEPDVLPPNVNELDKNAPARPVIRTLSPAAGTEKLLVSGGPYELMQRCPTFGCMAWVIDRQGNVLHSWEVDTAKLFAQIPHLAGKTKPENFYPSGIALTPDGGLVMAIQGRNTYPFQIGLVRIDRNGNVVWKHWNNSHHWIAVAADGTVYAPYREAIDGKTHFGGTAVETRCKANLGAEGIGVYAADGKQLRRISLLDAVDKSDFPGLLYGVRSGCDPLHLNSIDIVTPAIAAKIPGITAGDLLISLRELSTVAIIDGTDGRFKKVITGRSAAQHSPRFLPDGTALVLDNQGGQLAQGGSRVVRLDFNTGTSTTVFPQPGETAELPFFTKTAGHIEVSPDGSRAIVVGKEPGRAFEIDVASGKPLWSYRNSFDLAPYFAAKGIKAPVTRAQMKMWGVYYVTDAQFNDAGLGAAEKR
ncbi:hypothetical protein EUV02_06520 [Polymorphobacter arshaanensis]|uniref:Aryl sulfotransferase n=2 Tax=Glacieibacterium arshaanense TaxID=2511025 RepID=A0A4Y9EM24_9SPHN|nr:hypothetical protein EUV02_06520 [Polymorphobacter arshaanensis]